MITEGSDDLFEDDYDPDLDGPERDTLFDTYTAFAARAIHSAEVLSVPESTKSFFTKIMSSLEEIEKELDITIEETHTRQIKMILTNGAIMKTLELYFDESNPQIHFTASANFLRGDTLAITHKHAYLTQKLILWLLSNKPGPIQI